MTRKVPAKPSSRKKSNSAQELCSKPKIKKGKLVDTFFKSFKYLEKRYKVGQGSVLVCGEHSDMRGIITGEGNIWDEATDRVFKTPTGWVKHVMMSSNPENEEIANRQWCGYLMADFVFPNGVSLPMNAFRNGFSQKIGESLPLVEKLVHFRRFYGNQKKAKCIMCKNAILDITCLAGIHSAHILSKTNGGLMTLDNLVPSCPNCNNDNKTYHMFDYLFTKGRTMSVLDIVRRMTFTAEPEKFLPSKNYPSTDKRSNKVILECFKKRYASETSEILNSTFEAAIALCDLQNTAPLAVH